MCEHRVGHKIGCAACKTPQVRRRWRSRAEAERLAECENEHGQKWLRQAGLGKAHSSKNDRLSLTHRRIQHLALPSNRPSLSSSAPSSASLLPSSLPTTTSLAADNPRPQCQRAGASVSSSHSLPKSSSTTSRLIPTRRSITWHKPARSSRPMSTHLRLQCLQWPFRLCPCSSLPSCPLAQSLCFTDVLLPVQAVSV